MNLKKIQKVILLLLVFVMAFALNAQAATIQDYLFNKDYYLAQNPDVAAHAYYGTHAYEHFVATGANEGRIASVLFDAQYYLKQNPDVAAHAYYKTHPFEHFVNAGIHEGRIGSAAVAFDAAYYLAQNPDVAANSYYAAHPYEHFIKVGIQEGRIASKDSFDATEYLKQNPDIAATPYYAAHAYEHYITFGVYEGRSAHEHTMKIVKGAVDATCTEDGNIEYWVCEKCNKLFEDEAATKAINTVADTVIKAHHTMPEEGDTKNSFITEATCTENGLEIYVCTVCGKEIEEARKITPSTGHDYEDQYVSEATCNEAGYKVEACNKCGKERVTDIPQLQHNIVTAPAKEATCEEEGKTAGKYCSICGEFTEPQSVIPAKEHSLVTVKAKQATCSKEGNIEYKRCKNCNEYFDTKGEKIENKASVVTEKAPHTYKVDGKEVTELPEAVADCKTYTCIVCKTSTTVHGTEKIAENISGDPSTVCPTETVEIFCTTHGWVEQQGTQPHDYNEVVPEKEPKCGKDGNVAYATCKNCENYFIKEGETYTLSSENAVKKPATGEHANIVEVPAEPSTCTTPGNRLHYKCSDCNTLFSDEKGENVITSAKTAVADHILNKTEAKAATCTTDGTNAYWTCARCSEVFSDANGKTSTTVEAQKIAKTHGKNLELVEAKAATCTEGAVTAHWHCTACNSYYAHTHAVDEVRETIMASEVKIGENELDEEAIAALVDDEVDEDAHHCLADSEKTIPGTCTRPGQIVQYCDRCKKNITIKTLEIDPTNHDGHLTQDGDVYKCSDCKGTFSDASGKHEITD